MTYLHSKWDEFQSEVAVRELQESFHIICQCAIHFVFKQEDKNIKCEGKNGS